MGKKLLESVPNYPRKCFVFQCPGCLRSHQFVTQRPPGESGSVWEFNGDMEKPTFNPSLLYEAQKGVVRRCHLYVREGKIAYLSDCEHRLAGQTVEMGDV